MMKTSLFCGQVVLGLLTMCGTHAFAQQTTIASTVEPEMRLAQLNIQLPSVSEPVGIYRRAVVTDELVFLAGHIPMDDQGQIMRGKLGNDVELPDGQEAARRCGLAMLATLRSELGSLNRVERLVKTTGMVNCTADFTDQPAVVNGCSQLFADVFGKDRGIGARSAVGMSSLPKGAIVEIEAVFELRD